MIEISNHYLKAKISPNGAELVSLVYLPSNKELIWQADPGVWARSSPMLFPIVGKLKNNSFQLEGYSYNLTQHGFARDSVFQVEKSQINSATFSLSDSEETLSKYPFPFSLFTTFEIKGNSIEHKVTVQNTGSSMMPFSIGFHPGFNIFGSFEDYTILFEKSETLNLLTLEEGLITEKVVKQFVFESTDLPLKKEIFDHDALVFEGLNSNYTRLKKQNGSHELTIHHQGFPFLGIWSKPGASFICIEPWFGLADNLKGQDNLWDKKGILRLEPLHKFSCAYSIEVNHAI